MVQATMPVTMSETAPAAAWQLPETAVPERPALAPGVQLAGELQGTGFRDRQWLVERDGRFLQVTELLYRVAEQADGRRSLAEIADAVTEATDWLVTPDNVRQIIATKLLPLGVVAPANAATEPNTSAAAQPRAVDPLTMNAHMKVIGAGTIEPVARVLQVLFVPWLLLPILLAVAAAHWWLYAEHGVVKSIIQVLYTPWLSLPVLALTLLAGVFHEFGHASALRYGGGRARAMGAGLYLIFPAFYTDTTAGYRLGRWARVRTSLGGFYFHLIFSLAAVGLYLITRQEFVLLVVLIIDADIVRQSLPFVRFDGYWALADLTGIPDFFSQMGAFIRSVVRIPGWKGSVLPNLKPWVKAVFALYIVVTVPVLVFLLYSLVTGTPHLVREAIDSFRVQQRAFSVAWNGRDYLLMTAQAVQMLLLALQIVAPAYMLYFWTRGPIRAGWARRRRLRTR